MITFRKLKNRGNCSIPTPTPHLRPSYPHPHTPQTLDITTFLIGRGVGLGNTYPLIYDPLIYCLPLFIESPHSQICVNPNLQPYDSSFIDHPIIKLQKPSKPSKIHIQNKICITCKIYIDNTTINSPPNPKFSKVDKSTQNVYNRGVGTQGTSYLVPQSLKSLSQGTRQLYQNFRQSI